MIKEIKKNKNIDEILNIIKKEFNIKHSKTIYKYCCGTQRKKDFIDWLKNL